MKVRQSFVTNSSSSSFIISAQKKTPLKAKVEVDLSHHVREKITTPEELEAYNQEYGMDEGEIEQCKAALGRGEVVHIIHVCSDDGDAIESLLHYEGLNSLDIGPGINVIRGEY